MNEKVCKKCLEKKASELFSPNKNVRDGLNTYCRACAVERVREWRIANPTRTREWAKKNSELNIREQLPPDTVKLCSGCGQKKLLSAFGRDRNKKDNVRGRCKECCVEAIIAKYAANPEKYRAKTDAWRKKNPEQAAAYMAEYKIVKHEAIKARQRAARLENLDARREKDRLWAKKYPEKANAKNSRRRAAQTNATPKWLTKDHLMQMEAIYGMAQMMSRVLGELQHVDHIIPLRGQNVCGLHVPWNLQVIPAIENMSKHNKVLV